MAQNFRDMLSNRRFAVPLIALLGVCFIGLLLLGVVFIMRLGSGGDETPVAEVTATEAVEATDTTAPPPTTAPTETATARPSPTLVPLGTSVSSGAAEPTATVSAEATTDTTLSGGDEATAQVTDSTAPEATTEPESTAEPTTEQVLGDQETPTPEPGEDELAQTGIGWGLVVISAIGLGGVAIAARRLRLAG